MTLAPRSKGERPFEEGSQGWAALGWRLCLWLQGKPGGCVGGASSGGGVFGLSNVAVPLSHQVGPLSGAGR